MKKRVPALVLALLAAAACARQPDSAEFTRRVAERVKQAHGDADVAVVGPLQISVTPRNGRKTALDLAGVWKSCGERLGCGAPLEQYLASVVAASLVVEAPAKPEYLRPVLTMRPNLPPPGQSLSRAFVGDLVITYALDSGNATRPVTPADLQSLGLDEAGVHAAAIANLEAARPGIPHEPAEDSSPVWLVRTGNAYAASLLLLHDRWAALKPELKGELVVAAPHQNTLLVTGSGEGKEALERLKALAADHLDGAGGLTPLLLEWTPTGWVPFPR
jgi:Protein of unknown function (DUF1444)